MVWLCDKRIWNQIGKIFFDILRYKTEHVLRDRGSSIDDLAYAINALCGSSPPSIYKPITRSSDVKFVEQGQLLIALKAAISPRLLDTFTAFVVRIVKTKSSNKNRKLIRKFVVRLYGFSLLSHSRKKSWQAISVKSCEFSS